MYNFNETLKYLMKIKGINQANLAQKLGVTQQAVSKWCIGEREHDLKMICNICKALDTDPN